jgi:hypothetical protein
MKVQIAIFAGGIAIAGAVAYAQLGSQSPTPSTPAPIATSSSTPTPITTSEQSAPQSSAPLQTPQTKKTFTRSQRPQFPNSNGDDDHQVGDHHGGGDDGGFVGRGDD